MSNRRWQFSVRGLLLFTALVAVVAALDAAFPNAVDAAMIVTFFVSALVLPGTPQIVERWPWIGVLFVVVLGPWMFLVGFYRRPELFHHLAIFAIPAYLFATYFLIGWIRRADR